jgi:hypothetical protein
MSAARAAPEQARRDINPVEVIAVVGAFLAFEVWFFFFAGPVTGS